MSSLSGTVRIPACAIVGLTILCAAGSLRADSIVFSSSIDLTGTISYGGGTDPLIGTNLQIRDVAGPDGIKHPVHLVSTLGTGQLNFETGDFLNMTAGGDFVFGSGGAGNFITIHGTVPDAGVFGPPTPELLSGTITGAIVDPQLGTIKLGLFGYTGTNTENAKLLDFFGIPENSTFSFFTITLTGALNVQDDGSFKGRTLADKITTTVVPEPAPLSLGLASLILAGWMARDRRQGARSPK